MVNRYNNKKRRKKGTKKTKKRVKNFPNLLGGWWNGREGVLVRERARAGWIEETQRKTKGCGLKEESVMHHSVFLSPPTCTLLWIIAKTWQCLSEVHAETRACVAAKMLFMCLYGVLGSEIGVGFEWGCGGVPGMCPDPDLLFWCLCAENRPWL